VSLKIYCKDKECLPYKKHYTDAGLDLRSAEIVVLHPSVVTKVKTGIHVEIPEDYVGLIFPRSGLSTKYGIRLANTVGVIDSDYRGEILCALKTDSLITIEAYERIAQLVVVPVMINYEYVNTLEDLSITERGSGGFGSTG